MSKKKYHRGRRRPRAQDIEIKQTDAKKAERKQAETRQAGKTSENAGQTGKKQKNNAKNGAEPVLKHHDRTMYKLIGAVCMCVFVMLFVQMASASGKETSAEITMVVNDISILQDEAVPAVSAFASCAEAQKDVMLDESSGYRVRDLIQALNTGQGYTLSCEADGKEEGEFPLKIKFSDELSGKLRSDWKDIVYMTVSNGHLLVKNKLGEWKKDKFQRYDGTYVENDFVSSKGEQYYFDGDGKKVTGWQEINGQEYHFTETGIMEKDTWKKKDGGKCYLGSNGIMATGWVELGDELYCFNDEGVMLTGKQEVGSSTCEFADDGKLVSRKSKLDPDKPMMALTFDDGPGERTGELLDVLERYDAHATFFMQGKNVDQYKDEISRMKKLKCEIGNHSYDHPQLTQESDGGAGQVGRTNELLKKACGQPATVMRPPYGDYDDYVSANVGMPMILWNIDTLDWKTMNAQMTVDNVLTNADDGDIILMHDIHSPSVDAAIELIPKLINKGYQLVTVTELAEARGLVLKNGEAYTDFNKE